MVVNHNEKNLSTDEVVPVEMYDMWGPPRFFVFLFYNVVGWLYPTKMVENERSKLSVWKKISHHRTRLYNDVVGDAYNCIVSRQQRKHLADSDDSTVSMYPYILSDSPSRVECIHTCFYGAYIILHMLYMYDMHIEKFGSVKFRRTVNVIKICAR